MQNTKRIFIFVKKPNYVKYAEFHKSKKSVE